MDQGVQYQHRVICHAVDRPRIWAGGWAMLQGGGSEPGIRLAAWHDTIVDLLGEPLREMPHQLILETMAKTFDVTAVSHSTSDALGRQQVITHPRDVLKPV